MTRHGGFRVGSDMFREVATAAGVSGVTFHTLGLASLRRSRAYARFGAEFLDSVQGLATLKAFGQARARADAIEQALAVPLDGAALDREEVELDARGARVEDEDRGAHGQTETGLLDRSAIA